LCTVGGVSARSADPNGVENPAADAVVWDLTDVFAITGSTRTERERERERE
jgi:hypothetical protein